MKASLKSNSKLLAILTGFIVLALFYAVKIPPGEGVDEIAHFKYVLFIQNTKKLPVQPTQSGKTVDVVMGHHPPLYYALLALLLPEQDASEMNRVFRANPHFVWAENEGENGWNVMIHAGQDDFPGEGVVRTLYLARMWGIILGVVTLFAIYQAAKWAFPEITWLPMLITAVIAFNPSFIYMSTTIHHDILQATWFALGIWLIMRYTRQRTPYDAVIFGILVGCAVLTKVSGLVLGVGVAVVIIIRAWQAHNWRIFWRDGLISGGIAFLIAGWWFIRNQILYGDLVGWNAYRTVFHFNLRPEPSKILGFQDFFRQSSRNFWGGFGFMHITFPEISRYLWWGTALILLGWLILILRDKGFFKRYAVQLAISMTILLGILALYVRFSTINMGAGHGRYLFPAAFTIGLIIAVGILGLVGEQRLKWASSLFAVGLWCYALWLPLTQLLPKYAPISTLDTVPATAQISEQIVSPGVILKAFETDNDALLRPDMGLNGTLYWEIDPGAEEITDPYLHVSLESVDGDVIVTKNTWPVPSLPPDSWPQNKIIPTSINLYIPGIELPGTLLLKIATGIPEATAVVVAEFQTMGGSSRIDPEQMPNQLNSLFNDELLLKALEISDETFSAGEMVMVTLYWQVMQMPKTDHTLFIHLLDETGQLVAQLDRLVGSTANPATTWQADQTWRDSYPLLLPDDLPNGTYTLQIGMYDWPSIERLPIEDIDQNILQIGTINIISE